jgi:nitrogen fixation NifU-like protein
MFYNEKVLEHFLNPKNVGEIEDADGVGIIGDPGCGDCIKVFIKVKDRRIDDIKFKVYGCPAAIGTSSITTELAKGKTLDEAFQISNEDVVEALGGLPDPKIHCSVLCPAALRLAILDYVAKLKEKKLKEKQAENQ